MHLRTFLSFAVIALLRFTPIIEANQQPVLPGASPSALERIIKTAQQNVFMTSSVLPECYTYALERGDPKSGPSVTLSKLASGCKVPWHTHSANAQVLLVSGTFELHMKGEEAQVLRSGSYAYVPADHQHQETCVENCMYYVIREGPADVHYIDGAGKEISPQEALAAVGERPALSESAAQSTMSIDEELVGTWRLKSRVVSMENGIPVVDQGLGPTPKGYLVYDVSGHMAAQMMKADRTLAVDCGLSPTAAIDNSQSVNGYDAYFGTYTIDLNNHLVTHHLEGALAAADVGKNLVRHFEISGDNLTIVVRTNSSKGNQIRTLKWERVR